MALIHDLPYELMSMILEFTGTSSCIGARVCKLWNSLVKEIEIKSKNTRYMRLKFSAISTVSLFEWSRNQRICQSSSELPRGGSNKRLRRVMIKRDNHNHYRMFCGAASKHGHLEILKYLRGKGCSLDGECFIFAAKHGHLEVLKYLHRESLYPTLYFRSRLCMIAAKRGYLKILKYLCEQKGYPLNKKCCAKAAKGGHLEVLQYLLTRGCPCNRLSYYGAIAAGRLDIVKYLHEQGCRFDIKCSSKAIRKEN